MGRGSRDQLRRALSSHARNIQETYQLLDQSIPPSLEKVDWNEVIKLGDEISKQATAAGMLWSGEIPDAKQVEENMDAYCNTIHGLLLLCHGSMVAAGPTLRASIRASAKQVVDASISLLTEVASRYGIVWEACDALKKTPTTNYTAIGRAVTQVAVSVKDVLREMKELKPCSTTSTEDSRDHEGSHDEDGASEGEFGDDLSPKEMLVAQSVTTAVSDVLVVIKELIRFITGLLKQSKSAFNDNSCCGHSLERLLEICRGISVQVDELGASLYPPQEVPTMKVAVKKISGGVNDLQAGVVSMGGPSESFCRACESLETSLRKLESELDVVDKNLETEMQGLAV